MDPKLMKMLMNAGMLASVEDPGSDGGGNVEAPQETHEEDPGEDEPLGEGGVKALRAERKRAADAEKRANAAEEQLREIADAEKTDLQRAQDRLAELEAQVKEYEGERARNAMRANVLATKNVPSEWADFVKGDTEDEMNAAADKILANLERGATGPYLRPTSGQTGGSVEAGREAAKNFRP